jgi:hypothetical protein
MAEDNADLVGGDADTEPTNSSPNNAGGLLGAVSKASDGQKETDEAEKQQVKKLNAEYATGRKFDEGHREQQSKDRKYAAGKADQSWASDANLIGSFIDILCSFLYAQNPDVGCSAARHVGDQPNKQATDFAQTLELVISVLWRRGKLKKAAKKSVRSALSVGDGWFKALMYAEQRPEPQTEKDILDKEEQLEAIAAKKRALAGGEVGSNDEEGEEQSIKDQVAALKKKKELNVKQGMTVDFVRASDIQVSLDISDLEEYLDADWLAHDMYLECGTVAARFPRLSEDDLKSATKYYQKNNCEKSDTVAAATGDAVHDGQFTKDMPGSMGVNVAGSKPVTFYKVIELWDKRDGLIKTFVDGVEKWAVEPYVPPQATSRFYAFFRVAFFEVDGERHAQSLSWRLRKLQDEYSACRSNQRVTRERSIPAVLFVKGEIGPDDAQALEKSVNQEFIGLNPTSGAGTPLANLFAEKPIGIAPPGTYDTTPITNDMEKISGVAEAMQQAAQGSSQPKTATEANIQNTGFQSRTGTDRDALEEVLTDLAQYTAECAIQELTVNQAQRIAGPMAFWPYGMDVQDVLTMVDVDIAAGTTGKPNAAIEKQTWSIFLPLLEKSVMQIRQMQTADPEMAKSLENILRETLRRLDDRLDIADFIPKNGTQLPPPPPPPPPPAQVSIALKGALPPLDAVAIGARAAGVPPGPLEGAPAGTVIPPHPTPDGLHPGAPPPPPPPVHNAPPPAAPPTQQPHGEPSGVVIPQQ